VKNSYFQQIAQTTVIQATSETNVVYVAAAPSANKDSYISQNLNISHEMFYKETTFVVIT